MFNSIIQLSLIGQLPWIQAGQLLLVVGVSFVIITAISSTYRFHKLIELGDDALTTEQACNDFFFVQVTRYLSKINRTSTGFGIVVIQFCTQTEDKRAVQEALLQHLKGLLRTSVDKACLFRTDCIAAILDTEERNLPACANRLVASLQIVAPSCGITALRAGVSTFPLYFASTQVLVEAATTAMEKGDFTAPQPVYLAPPPEGSIGIDTGSADLGELSRQDKNSAIDPLTGVLSSGVVASYMRKYLSDIRLKKKSATLLCVGINNMEQLTQLHGTVAAEDVIVGVSKILQRLTRNGDLIGRFHYADFLVLTDSSLKQGEQIAHRLREAVQKEAFISNGKKIKASVSIGISAHPEHGRNMQDLFRGAHRAFEVLRDWNTTACLVYDPAQHSKKGTKNAPRR
ncbi:MAG: GGDEF domain-containing protein [Kiritimatiellaceae bacterium]|nr:GGDEF domain-containing protein [Kiritimatiellaceae bacterium]